MIVHADTWVALAEVCALQLVRLKPDTTYSRYS